MHKRIIYTSLVVSMLLLIFFVLTLSKYDHLNNNFKNNKFHFGLDINIDYPHELAEKHEIIERTINIFLIQKKDEFLKFVLEALNITEITESLQDWSLNISFEEFNLLPQLVSIAFTINEYTGGAHSNTYFKTFTFDLANQKIVEFEDLFDANSNSIKELEILIQKQLRQQLGEFFNEEWVKNGTGNNIDNYRNFALSKDFIMFFFQPYQVAAYAAGYFVVKIPLLEIKQILNQQLAGIN